MDMVMMVTEVAAMNEQQVSTASAQSKILVNDLSLFYGEKQALFNVSLDIKEKCACHR